MKTGGIQLRLQQIFVLLLVAALTALGGALIAFDNRIASSHSSRTLLTDRAAENARLSAGEKTRDARRNWEHAKSQVVRAIALHRSGEEGKDVVMKVTGPDDPLFQLVRKIFIRAGVPDALVEESLKDWTKGVNILEIAQRWQEKGIKVRDIVREAEGEGFPVSRIVKEKDTLR